MTRRVTLKLESLDGRIVPGSSVGSAGGGDLIASLFGAKIGAGTELITLLTGPGDTNIETSVELFGNAVSFTGKGDVNLDGTDLAVELYPSWARIEQLLPPVVRSVPPALSKNILTVEAKGKISGNPSDLKFMKKPMPIIVDPLLNLRDRVLGERMPAPTIEPRGPMPAAPMPVSIAPPLR